MICEKCGNPKRLLFVSWSCDFCDGKIQRESTEFSVREVPYIIKDVESGMGKDGYARLTIFLKKKMGDHEVKLFFSLRTPWVLHSFLRTIGFPLINGGFTPKDLIGREVMYHGGAK